MRVGRVLLLLAVLGAPAWAAPPTPEGVWRTFDDDGRETGTVTIRSTGGALEGTVTAIDDPAKKAAVCRKCSGELANRPVIGLRVIWGVTQDGESWDGGHILDPESGDVYRVKMRLEDGGATLALRGFLGISLFGRSQTWRRVATP